MVAATMLSTAGAFVFSLFYVSQGAVELNPWGLTATSLSGTFAFIALFSALAFVLLKDPYRLLALSLPLAVGVSDLAGDVTNFLTSSLYIHVAVADITAASVPVAFAVWLVAARERAGPAQLGR
ncbi:MAG: hypothetical protein KGI26_05625 [Thaumarchaeota archaeon]|nr:hypothetical protein [Nitrososphaerota archaeon]